MVTPTSLNDLGQEFEVSPTKDTHFGRGSYLLSFTVSATIPSPPVHYYMTGSDKKMEDQRSARILRLLHRLFSDSCAE